ncbi:hypothetical protein [Bacteroides ovatus]|uniref:hypothetical protein n=1 Tax=Bacteroides ovatus TaxID=28116 RepID=UPI003567078E
MRKLLLVLTLLLSISTYVAAQNYTEVVYLKNGSIIKGVIIEQVPINPEKPDVPINKNDAFQKVQKRRVQEKR